MTSLPTATTAAPTQTPTITPTPTTTPRPSPTPIRARIDVRNQTIDERAVLKVEQVVSTDPGWLVIFNTTDGVPQEVIGQTAVSFGVLADLEVEIDLERVSDELSLQLYQSTAEDTFDIESNIPFSPPVSQSVTIDLEVMVPTIEVNRQTLSGDGVLLVDSVLSNNPGWLVVHNVTDDGTLGQMVGIVHVEPGLSRDVPIPLWWREATSQLMVTLHEDNGRLNEFEPEIDTQMVVAQEPIEASVTVALPVDVLVYDQPLDSDGLVTIDRATVPDDGWLAVYYDDGGVPGLIIGYAALEAGVNEQIKVDVIDSAVTELLYIVLHHDSNGDGEFDIPLNDPPFRQDDQAVDPFTFRTAPFQYFVAYDQPIQEQADEVGIVIETVFVLIDSWVVVQEVDAEGELGEFLGRTAVNAGINHNVFVPVNGIEAGQVVMVTLYRNSGDAELFETEEGIDVPLRSNRQDIQVPLRILELE